MTRLLLTGLEGPPNGRRSRADMGLAARAALGFPVIGAFFDTGLVHGPQRPAVIAERFACPSCDAPPGEACHLNALQSAIHEQRHRVAQRAMWRELMREMDVQTGWELAPRRS